MIKNNKSGIYITCMVIAIIVIFILVRAVLLWIV